MSTLSYAVMEVTPGTTIVEAVTESMKYAARLKCCIRFEFNGVALVATPYSIPSAIVASYWAVKHAA